MIAGRSSAVSSGGLLAGRERGHADHRQVVVVDRDPALVFRIGQGGERLHVRDVDLVFVEADGVVAELLGDAVALAVGHGELIEPHLRIQVRERQLVLGQGREQALLDAAADVDRVDHHHVPVAGLGLLDDREAGAGALVFLDVHGDVVGVLERAEQRRIGVVAPDQRVELCGAARARSHGRRDRGEEWRRLPDGHRADPYPSMVRAALGNR